MKWTASTARGVGLAAVMLSMGVGLVLSGASAASAQQSAAQARTVEGVWHVQVTIRDCATGVALAPVVNSLVTFAAGGTLHESVGGGGFAPGMQQKPTRAPVANEAANGVKNARYTVAMARTSDPHSATAQFFINVADNAFLNHTAPTAQGWGYAVAGAAAISVARPFPHSSCLIA